MTARISEGRAAVAVTLLTLVAQALMFATQVVIANAFGATLDVDAFMAASTLPQYLVGALAAVLGAVLIPVLLRYRAERSEEDAQAVVRGVTTVTGLLLIAAAAVGFVLAEPLVRATTPGLSEEALQLASRLSLIIWPSIVGTGLASLFTGVLHADRHFAWSVSIPVVGALLNLAMVSLLASPLGVTGVAIASTSSLMLQALLLWPRSCRVSLRSLVSAAAHPGVWTVLAQLWPLFLSGLIARWTSVVDRYVASELATGAISYLWYSFRVVTILSVLIAGGIVTVVYPRMADALAKSDPAGFDTATNRAFVGMWLIVAPVTALTLALAGPGIASAFQRGSFTPDDAQTVGELLRVYSLALPAMCLGNITGRMFYASQRTRLLALGNVAEALAYVVYTPILAARLGVLGVALSYVIYFNVSLAWQLFLLSVRKRREGRGGPLSDVARPFATTAVASAIAGGVAFFLASALDGRWVSLMVGALGGTVCFTVVLRLLGSDELDLASRVIIGLFVPRRDSPGATAFPVE